jgi:hypothetical protein
MAVSTPIYSSSALIARQRVCQLRTRSWLAIVFLVKRKKCV